MFHHHIWQCRNFPRMYCRSYYRHRLTYRIRDAEEAYRPAWTRTHSVYGGSRPEQRGSLSWGLEGGGEWLLRGNSCFSELTSNFPFFSSGSTWASLDFAASLLGTPSPSISSTTITVSHFPKLLAGNMSDLMLSPKYTTCRVRKRGWQRGQLVYFYIAVVKLHFS